jgi:hypothetical protein
MNHNSPVFTLIRSGDKKYYVRVPLRLSSFGLHLALLLFIYFVGSEGLLSTFIPR